MERYITYLEKELKNHLDWVKKNIEIIEESNISHKSETYGPAPPVGYYQKKIEQAVKNIKNTLNQF